MAVGSFFEDESAPQVMVQVGNAGDSGIIEVFGMLWTVKGPTKGCILVQWNVHESTQGSAAMWDSHFRVSGATGSDLSLSECPKGSQNTDCMAASLLLHLTPQSSGYLRTCGHGPLIMISMYLSGQLTPLLRPS